MSLTRLVQRLISVTLVAVLSGCALSLPKMPGRQTMPQPEQQPEPQPVAEQVQEPVGPKELEIIVLHKAGYNPYERDNGKNYRALDSVEKYQVELALHSIEAVKSVDYETAQVLVSSLGEKPTGGYKITATKAEEFENRVVVTVVQSGPGPGCVTTQEKTHPFEFVLIPSLKSIEIFERLKLDECE